MTQEIYTDFEVKPHPSETSFGQKLVGITFNPSGDPNVQRAKELCAELADILHDKMMDSHENGTATSMKTMLAEQTYGKILDAQMNVVKVLTLKS
jgi:hypothetical protein